MRNHSSLSVHIGTWVTCNYDSLTNTERSRYLPIRKFQGRSCSFIRVEVYTWLLMITTADNLRTSEQTSSCNMLAMRMTALTSARDSAELSGPRLLHLNRGNRQRALPTRGTEAAYDLLIHTWLLPVLTDGLHHTFQFRHAFHSSLNKPNVIWFSFLAHRLPVPKVPMLCRCSVSDYSPLFNGLGVSEDRQF